MNKEDIDDIEDYPIKPDKIEPKDTSLSEDEEIDSILKGISAELTNKLERELKETKYEPVAKTIALKIMEAAKKSLEKGKDESDVNEEESGNHSEDQDSETNEEENVFDKIYSDETSTSNSENEDADGPNNEKENLEETEEEVEENVGDDKDKEMSIVLDIDKIVKEVVEDQNLSENEEEKDDKTDDAEEGDNTKDGEPKSAVEKFRTYLDELMKNHQSDKDMNSQATVPPRTTSKLETKRQNLLSITKQITKLIIRMVSGSSTDSDGSKTFDSENDSPSLSGLYTALSKYPSSSSYFHDPQTMHCPAQPFHSRISVYGEVFPDS